MKLITKDQWMNEKFLKDMFVDVFNVKVAVEASLGHRTVAPRDMTLDTAFAMLATYHRVTPPSFARGFGLFRESAKVTADDPKNTNKPNNTPNP